MECNPVAVVIFTPSGLLENRFWGYPKTTVGSWRTMEIRPRPPHHCKGTSLASTAASAFPRYAGCLDTTLAAAAAVTASYRGFLLTYQPYYSFNFHCLPGAWTDSSGGTSVQSFDIAATGRRLVTR